jgi:curved DNA-binding protein CbpA
MGNQALSVDPIHMRIYSNMIQINDPIKRIQIIQTCLASMEYVQSAKRCGIYSYLLHYISTVQTGGTPPILPGEQVVSRAIQNDGFIASRSLSRGNEEALTKHSDVTPGWKVIADTPKQKAMTYFASCLEVLGIQEEVALTDESLKKAYKRVALRAHPDKGGSEEYFEAVTRAYAYLSEILKHMKGGKRSSAQDIHSSRASDKGYRDNGQRDKGHRDKEYRDNGEPVRLNAKKLDMNAFNKLFEETHLPDPDSDGYGDWLKHDDEANVGPKFKGKFNRDVFNQMFDEETRRASNSSQSDIIVHPSQMALTLNPNCGVDFVGERPNSYTAAPNARVQFTDLRGAYTSDSTISDKVSNVSAGNRNYEQYRASREKAPDPFTNTELHGIQEFEKRQSQMDFMRERKRAEMAVRNQQYHDRMKQLCVTDGTKYITQ